MLTQVPTAMRTAGRAMTLRHPNAMDCQVFRKTVTRTAEVGPGPGTIGGLPTLGGMAVIDPEDEPQVDYALLGEGKVLFVGGYEQTTLNDNRDAADQQAISNATIEPITAGAFEPKDGDLVMAMPGAGVVIPYEITRVLNAVNIPPYLPKYELAAQGDLMFDPEIAALQAGRP